MACICTHKKPYDDNKTVYESRRVACENVFLLVKNFINYKYVIVSANNGNLLYMKVQVR